MAVNWKDLWGKIPGYLMQVAMLTLFSAAVLGALTLSFDSSPQLDTIIWGLLCVLTYVGLTIGYLAGISVVMDLKKTFGDVFTGVFFATALVALFHFGLGGMVLEDFIEGIVLPATELILGIGFLIQFAMGLMLLLVRSITLR